MTTDRRCPAGHVNPADSRYCTVCGASIEVLPPPAPPAAAVPPDSAPPPYVDAPNQPPRRRRTGLWIGLSAAVVVVVALGALVLVAALGGGTTTVTYSALTPSQARAALLGTSDLPAGMAPQPDEMTDLDREAFSVDDTADCRTVIGAERMGDISPDVSPGALAYPPDARGAESIVGIDFADLSDDYVSSLSERILIFPTAAEATAYVAALRAALPQCLTSTTDVSTDDTRALYRIDRRVTEDSANDGDTSAEDGDTIGWSRDSRFDSVGLVDISFSFQSSNRVVAKGPNVLLVEWTKDSDDFTSTSDFRSAADEAVRSFEAAVVPED